MGQGAQTHTVPGKLGSRFAQFLDESRASKPCFGVTLPSKQASDGLVDMAAKLAEGTSRMDRRFMVMEIRWQSSRLRYVLGSVRLEKKKSGNPLLHAYDVDKSLEDFQCLEMITREFGNFQKITRASKFYFCYWMILSTKNSLFLQFEQQSF
ncbi:hypothetical protein SELMODRAFT_429243 [Selaginella moellendorffii]|uniref:Uncharacterized protein n=1 Tax=Selaginella moellendorffii TaxID=88036 RepID=D8T5I7_SELML|nr:hypothetical protein SELMODRAFT_429243 [Selaginella moellendorffii]